MTDSEMPCVVCPQYDRRPELCDRPPVCDTCRGRIRAGLEQIPALYARIDPTPGSGAGQRISGTLDTPLGVRVGALDQLTPVPSTLAARTAVGCDDHLVPVVRTWYETRDVRRLDTTTLDVVDVPEEIQRREVRYGDGGRLTPNPNGVGRTYRSTPAEWVEAGDQTGETPVAVWLDSWVRDWITYRPQHREHLPVPTVDRLTDWLLDRLDWALDNHPAIDEFAADLRHQLAVLRTVTGDVAARPEYKDGVVCRSEACDMKALYRKAGDDWIECAACGRLYSPEEYREWVDMLAGHARQRYDYDRQTRAWVRKDGAA